MDKSKRAGMKLPVTSRLKHNFKYVKEGNKMTDAMREMYDIFEEETKEECIKEGRKRGRKEGIKEGAINILLTLVKDGIISTEEAAKRANISVTELNKYLNE